MDLNETRSPCGEDVAPYALGALDPGDARRFEDHLARCELCRADLAALKPVVDALPATAEQVEPPPELRRRLMAVVEEEAAARREAERPARTRSWLPRPLPALAAACVLVVAGIGLGVALTGDDMRMFETPGPDGAKAQLRVEGDDAELRLEGMPRPAAGKVMQVWLMREGSDTPIPTDALFEPNWSGAASVDVPGDMDGVTRVLISEEPDGGSRAPTSTPMVDFRLS